MISARPKIQQNGFATVLLYNMEIVGPNCTVPLYNKLSQGGRRRQEVNLHPGLPRPGAHRQLNRLGGVLFAVWRPKADACHKGTPDLSRSVPGRPAHALEPSVLSRVGGCPAALGCGPKVAPSRVPCGPHLLERETPQTFPHCNRARCASSRGVLHTPPGRHMVQEEGLALS